MIPILRLINSICLWSLFYDKSLEALGKGAAIEKIVAMPSRERIGRFKYADEKQTESEYNEILSELDSDIDKAVKAKDEN